MRTNPGTVRIDLVNPGCSVNSSCRGSLHCLVMEDALLADEYVRGLVMDQLSENSVKREEVSPPNQKTIAWVQATASAQNTSLLHHQQQQQLQQQQQQQQNQVNSQTMELDYGSRGGGAGGPMNGHRSGSGKYLNAWHSPPEYNGGPMGGQAVLVNTPSTPPETPPVSGSPTSSSLCNVQGAPPPGYIHQQAQHRMSYGPAVNGALIQENSIVLDEMSCYQDPGRDGRMDIPLDLRPPHCGDLDCERRLEYYHHHLNMPLLTQNAHHHQYYSHPCRPMSGGSASTIISSPKMSSCPGTGAVNGFGNSGGGGKDDIDDDVLMTLTVRELNKKLHGFPREDVMRFKQKRRTLKNRGYAQNCRSKRLQQRHELELTNQQLMHQLQQAKLELQRAHQERDQLKQMLQMRSASSGNCNNANNNGLANGGSSTGGGNAVCQQLYGGSASQQQQQSSLMVTSSSVGGNGGSGSHSNSHVNNHSPSPETYL